MVKKVPIVFKEEVFVAKGNRLYKFIDGKLVEVEGGNNASS